MFFFKSNNNFIKYIFFLQLLYSNILLATEKDLRANPEVGLENFNKTSINFSKNNMVVCADSRAALAAKEVLEKGGNIIDALITAQNVLSVVEPQSSGIGGGGFLLYYNKKLNLLEAWDGRETAPLSSTPNQFIDLENKKMPFLEAVVDDKSIGVPGLYSMLADVHSKHGKMEWESLFDDAVSYAKKFKVSNRLNKMLKWAPHLKDDPYSMKTYFDRDSPKKIGAFIRNIELVNTLKSLSKDRYSIKNGEVSKLIHNKLSPVLNEEDLNSWKTIKRKPICKKYKAYNICGFPPPTSGGISVLQILGILENIKTDFNPFDTIMDEHIFLEASRLAYADREVYIADPDFFDVPVKGLLNKNYLKQRAKLINTEKATKEIRHGDMKMYSESVLDIGVNLNFPSTTHISIVDANGNAVALTSSIEFAFGSGRTVGGFFLNNQLTDFSFVSRQNNGGLIANSVEANKKPRSSMAPTLIFKNNDLVGIIGSPGGSRIICYVAKTIFYLINFDLDVKEVIDLPHLCSRGSNSEIEKGERGNQITKQLKLLNHDITRNKMTSGLNIIWKNKEFWIGASDYRREGVAVGF